MAENGTLRIDDPEMRSKSQLIDQINQLRADSEANIELSQAHLLHELQNHQVELEIQNRELREAQQRLEETRDRYADLYDFSPVGYLTLDESGRILEINLTGAAMLGDERANLIGKPFAARLAPNDSQLFFLYLNRVFHTVGGSNIVTEVKLKHGNGELDVHLESSPMKNTAVRGRNCRMVITDISEQKRATEVLEQTRSAHEALLNTIPAMVFFKDRDLRYTAVSQAFADFFGRPEADILGKTSFDLMPREQAEEVQQIDGSAMLSGKPLRNREHTVSDAKGNPFILSASLAPYFSPDGKIAGLVGVNVDVTGIKEAEQRSQDLLRQNRLLTQQLFSLQEAERRHLARELHDELGQWLTAIQAEAGAICSSSDIAKAPQIHASALAIGNNAAEIHTMIRRILHRLRPALLDQLGLADSLGELVTQWRKRHPKVVCDLDLDSNLGDLPESLNITLYRIMQEAFTNIANHAQACNVKVRLRRVPGVGSSPEHLLLTIQDDGKGMDPSLPGKGLGILGMRERVIASGGEFMSHSEQGQGVCLEIRLPLVAPREERRKKHE